MSSTTGGEHLDLVGLLRGELRNAEAATTADHLRACAACRAELVEVAVGHGMLTAATRTLAAPPPVEVAEPVLPAPRPPGRRRLAVALVAAASVLVAGALGAWLVLDDDGGTDRLAASAELSPVEGDGAGEVTMAVAGDAAVPEETVTRMTIRTEDLPRPPGSQFYYAWLLDPETNKMLPLGQIGPSGRATFELPVRLLGEYSAIDVSLEADDGDPEHSVTSVLRGSYDAADVPLPS